MILTFKTSDVTRHTPMLRVASVERKEKNNARPETSMKRTYRTRNNFIPGEEEKRAMKVANRHLPAPKRFPGSYPRDVFTVSPIAEEE